MFSSTILSIIAGAALASAQDGTSDSGTSVSVYPPIVPSNIPDYTRVAWCNGQLAACGLLCQDQKSGMQIDNTCDPDDLTYTCVCDDGKSPNATQYSQTIPYYICSEQVQECVKACGNDNICGENCKSNKRCGASDPKPPKSTKGSKPPKSTATVDSSTVAYDGFGGSASTATGEAGSGGSGSGSSSTINLKGAGNSLAAFEVYSVAVIVASFGLSIFAFLQ